MRRLLTLAAVISVALVSAASALAWHVQDVTVSAACNTQSYTYDVSAAITQSTGYPGALVKSITPSTFPGTSSGVKSVVVVVKWTNSNDTQTLTKSVTLAGTCVAPPPPDPVCPEGYVRQGDSLPLLCLKTVTVEVVKEVPVTNTVYVDVPGPTVEKIVTVVVDRPIPGKTVTKIVKVQGKTKYIYRTKTKIKRVKVFGICKYNGHLAVPGSG